MRISPALASPRRLPPGSGKSKQGDGDHAADAELYDVRSGLDRGEFGSNRQSRQPAPCTKSATRLAGFHSKHPGIARDPAVEFVRSARHIAFVLRPDFADQAGDRKGVWCGSGSHFSSPISRAGVPEFAQEIERPRPSSLSSGFLRWSFHSINSVYNVCAASRQAQAAHPPSEILIPNFSSTSHMIEMRWRCRPLGRRRSHRADRLGDRLDRPQFTGDDREQAGAVVGHSDLRVLGCACAPP